MNRILAIAACVVLVLLGFLFWGSQTTEPASPPTASPTALPATPAAPTPEHSTAPQAAPQATREVIIEQQPIRLNAEGHLVPTPSVRELFDQLAREQQGVPVDLWKQSILDAYQDGLGEAAHQELQTLLNRYVEYNLALQLLPMDGVASLQDALNHLASIRSDYMGPGAEAMFSDWRQIETFATQMVDQVTTSSDPVALKQSLQEQVYALPASVQPRAQRVLDHSEDLFNAMAAGQAEPAIVRSIAEQMAAMALIQPDFVFGDPTQEFMNQYNLYTEAKQNLQQQKSLSGEDDPQLDALRQEYFSGSDALRVKTLDRADWY